MAFFLSNINALWYDNAQTPCSALCCHGCVSHSSSLMGQSSPTWWDGSLLGAPTLVHIKSHNKLSLNLKWQEILIACLDSVLGWSKMSWQKELLPFTHQSGGKRKRELETDPWPPNELRLAARLENIHSYTVTHSWCDNFIPPSFSAVCMLRYPSCCVQQIQVFFPLLKMLGLWKVIRGAVTSDLFNVPDSDCSIDAGLGGWEWVSGPTLISSVMG